MGVYIDMEMPKDGVYWCEIGIADDIAMITIHGEDRKSFPLVPVPAHGRLIDADAMIASIKRQTGFLKIMGGDIATMAELLEKGILQEIENAPTIIEAGEGE